MLTAIDRRERAWKLTGTALLALTLAGCVRGCPSSRPPIHPNPNMDWQEKYEAQEESRFFYDGAAMRTPVEGTVPRERTTVIDGRLTVAADPHRTDQAFQTGKDESGAFLTRLPPGADGAVVARGAMRYDIYCRPCHGEKGNGQGVLTERAKVPVPSFREDRLMGLAAGEVFDVITNGKGLMPAYRYPIPAADRWAIVAHVRRLQGQPLGTELAQARP